MKNIEHLKPKEAHEEDRYIHKFKLQESGERIGDVEAIYKNSPFPFYYISNLTIDSEKRGRGFGGKFLREINNFLDSKRKTGLLVSSIHPDRPESQIYRQNGWQELNSHPDWYIYNPPKNLDDSKIAQAIKKIEDTIDRI